MFQKQCQNVLHLKFKLENSMLELTGYDLEIGIKTVIPVKSDDSGEFILNAKLFSEMLRKMPSEEILIEVSENFQVTISGGVTTFNIQRQQRNILHYLRKRKKTR